MARNPVQRATKTVIGVDPGSPLALAMVNASGRWVAHASEEAVAKKNGTKWDNEPDRVYAIFKKWIAVSGGPQCVEVVIEKVNPMPGEGLLSSAKFIGSVWLVRGVCASFGIKPYFVSPKVWKRMLHLSKDKKKSVAMAKYLFPDRNWRLQYDKDHNYAEAALLAYYRRQNLLGLL